MKDSGRQEKPTSSHTEGDIDLGVLFNSSKSIESNVVSKTGFLSVDNAVFNK